MPTTPTDEWIAAMRCSRCRHVIRHVSLEVGADGTFELEGLPDRCTKEDCQAGFGSRTAHTLDVTFYRRQALGGRGD